MKVISFLNGLLSVASLKPKLLLRSAWLKYQDKLIQTNEQ